MEPSLYQQLLNQSAPIPEQDTAALQVATGLTPKEQKIDSATQRKMDALERITKNARYRTSLQGQVAGLGTDSDLARSFSAGAVSGVGSIVDATAVATGSETLEGAGNWVQDGASNIRDSRVGEYQSNVRNATPTGDLFSPSTWDLGDGNLEGIGGLLAETTGQMAPQLAGGALGGALGAAVVGGAQAAGGAGREQWEYVDGLSHDDLLLHSGLYRDLLATGSSVDDARAEVRSSAAQASAVAAGAIGGAGGAATHYILSGLPNAIKSKLAADAGAKGLKARAGALGVSAVEEGVQESAEVLAAKASANVAIEGDQQIDEGAFTDLILGAGTGATISAGKSGIELVTEGASIVKDNITSTTDSEESAEQSDPTSKNYDPISIARKAYKEAKEGDSTQVTKSAENIDALITRHKDHIENIQLRGMATTPAGRERLNGTLSNVEEQLKAPDLEPTEKKELEELRDTFSALLENGASIETADVRKELNTAKTTMEKLTRFRDGIQGKEEAGEDLLTEDPTEDVEVRANRSVVRAMNNPDAYSEEQLNSLISQTGNGLTDNQKTYLRSLSAAQNHLTSTGANAPSLAETRKGVYYGADGFKGLREYRRDMASAVRAKNTGSIRRELNGIKLFNKSHLSKAATSREALNQAQATGKPLQVVRSVNGTWSISPETLPASALSENKGLTINSNSENLVNNIEQEAKAISLVKSEMEALTKIDTPVETATSEKRPEDVTPLPKTETNTETNTEIDTAPTPVQESVQEDVVYEESEVEPEIQEPDAQPETSNTIEPIAIESGELNFNDTPSTVDGTELTTNLLQKYGQQVKGRDGSPRALVVIKSLASVVKQQGAEIFNTLSEKTEVTSVEETQLSGVLGTAAEWGNTVQELIQNKREGFQHQDWVGYFTENGTLPENVTTAIGLAAYEWAGANISSLGFNTDDDIRRMLNLDKSETIPIDARNTLRKAGVRREFIVRDIGQQAAQLLGLQLTNAPANYAENLRSALGIYGLMALQDQGIVSQTTIRGMQNLRTGTYDPEDNTSAVFVSPVLEDEVLPTQSALLVSRYKDVRKLLPTYFGVEPLIKGPVLEDPKEWSQSRIKNSFQGVPEELASAQKEVFKRPWHVRESSTAGIFMNLSSDVQERLSGVRSISPETMHINERERIEAKNAGLLRELDHFRDFIEEAPKGLGQSFWLKPIVWNVQRVGLESQQVNPQTSKIHRHLVSMNEWRAPVSVDKRSQSFKRFSLALAVGLGIDVDKQPLNTTYEDMRGMWVKHSPAINVLTELLEGAEVTPEREAVIAEAVESIGESMHSFDALVGMAQWQQAKNANQKEFTTDIMFEVDGVTNGPMLTHLFIGAQNTSEPLTDTVEKGGFFKRGSRYPSFGHFKAAGNNDLYETLAGTLHSVLATHSLSPAGLAVQSFVGNIFDEQSGTTLKAGRNMVKTPVTAATFGSSISKVLQSMGAEVLTKVEKQIEDLVKNEADTETVKDMVVRINTVITEGKGSARDLLPLNSSASDLLNLKWTPRQEAAFVSGYIDSYGQAVKEAIEKQSDGFLNNRKVLNDLADTTYQTFKVMYETAREDYKKELLNKGRIKYRTTKTGERVVIADLTAKQEAAFDARIKDMLPIVHTYFSQLQGALENGLSVYKQKNVPSTTDEYVQEVTASRNVNVSGGKGYKSMSIRGLIKELDSPGVGTLIKQVHSSDSAISASVYKKFPTLNLHDANGIPVNKITEVAEAMNKATFDVLAGYSIPLENLEALQRVIKGIDAYARKYPNALTAMTSSGLSDVYADKLRKLMPNEEAYATYMSAAKGNPFTAYLRAMDEYTRHMEKVKLVTLQEVGSVNQYSYEGGEYKVTDTDREFLASRLNELDTRPSALTTSEEALSSWFTGEATTGPLLDADIDSLLQRGRQQLRANPDDRALRHVLKSLISEGDVTLAMENIPKADGVRIAQLLNDASEPVTEDTFKPQQRERVTKLVTELQGRFPLWESELEELAITSKDHGESFDHHIDNLFTVNGQVNAVARTAFVTFLKRAHQVFASTPWGPLGTPVHASAPEIVNYLEEGTRTAGQTLNFLRRTLANGPGSKTVIGKYYIELAAQLSKVVDAALPVKLITPKSGPVEGTYDYPETAAALYVGGKSPQILVKSPDFKYSNVTSEALLHEMVHAAVTDKILNTNETPRVRAAVQQLESVMSVVRDRMSQNPTEAQQFTPALESVDEFLTWGMTNRKFQKYLEGIEFKYAKKSGGLTSALKAFLAAVGTLLNLTSRDTALAAVLINGAELLEDSVQDADTRTERVVRAMDLGSSGPEIKDWTAMQVFEALGTDATTNTPHLRNLMTQVATKVHGAAGAIKSETDSMAAYNPRDIYLSALVGGKVPFYSESRSVFRFSEQEAFVLEQVQQAVEASLTPTSLAYRELTKMFKTAQAALTPADFYVGDWDRATALDKANAQEQYDFVFKARPTTKGTSNYLSSFAALVAVYEPLRTALDQSLPNTPSEPKSLVERIEALIGKLLDVLAGKFLSLERSGTLTDRLTDLIRNMSQIEANRKMVLEQRRNSSLEDRLEMFNTATGKLRTAIGNVGNKLQASESPYVGALGSVLNINAEDRISEWEKHFQKVRNRMFEGRQGVVAGLITEVKGESEANAQAYTLLREANKVEKSTVQEVEGTRRLALESFDDAGSYLTQEDTYALTATILETDLVSTLGHFDLQQWETMIADDQAIDTEIDQLRSKVVGSLGQYGKYVARGAADMGYYLATGINHNPNLAMNVETLLSLQGTQYVGAISQNQIAEIRDDVDVLASLYAVRNTNMEQREKVRDVLARENLRGDASGVLTLARLHEHFKEESLEKLFDDNPYQMRKGFIKEIFNQHNDVVVANEKEGEDLLALGYRRTHEVLSDNQDPDLTLKHVYIADGAGLRRRETGIVAFVNKKARGSSNTDLDVDAVKAAKAVSIDALFNTPVSYTPGSSSERHFVPLRNDKGEVASYRYTMTTQTKDTVMERHNAFDDVLGGMAGNMLNKVATKVTNRKAVQLLRDIYKDSDLDPEDYIRVSIDSLDKEVRETFRLMSADMRGAVREIWGSDELYVPVDLYDLFFGYRRKSLSGIFDKPEEARTALEHVITNTLETFLGKEAALKLSRAENMWMEAINVLKDILVVKNLFTLLGNIVSNFSTLAMHGVSIKDQVNNHRIATQALLDYQKDSGELLRLERAVAAGVNTGSSDVTQRITVLKDSLARNPIKDMVEAGLVHTIVEDIENDDDRFSYKTRFTNWVEDKTERIPEGIREVGKHLLMTHDTPQYKLLYRATSTSDFAARYVLLQHLMNRRNNPLTKAEALSRVDSEFVNYDIPTHSTVDYLNRVGFTMFTKYYLRIQKVLFTLYREQPLRSLLVSLLGNLIDGVQTLSDSAFWGRLGNITSTGVLELPDALDEIVPIKVLTSMID